MQVTLHATSCDSPNTSRRIALGASDVCLDGENRHAPSRHCGDARVYGHTTTAVHDDEYTPCLRSVSIRFYPFILRCLSVIFFAHCADLPVQRGRRGEVLSPVARYRGLRAHGPAPQPKGVEVSLDPSATLLTTPYYRSHTLDICFSEPIFSTTKVALEGYVRVARRFLSRK